MFIFCTSCKEHLKSYKNLKWKRYTCTIHAFTFTFHIHFKDPGSIQWWLNMYYLLKHPFECQTAWKQILSLPALDFQTFIYKAGQWGPSSSTNKYCIFMLILSCLLTWHSYIKFLCTYSLSIFLLLHWFLNFISQFIYI